MDKYKETILKISDITGDKQKEVTDILVKAGINEGKPLSKSIVLEKYEYFKRTEGRALSVQQEEVFYRMIKKKQIRSVSGVATVTVLTKPYPCPGRCIFCPNDPKMPKSYIASEPGAQRAYTNKFDPYLQTFNRLCALNNTGHPTDKIEMIILGGTFTHYPLIYQIWFVKRCFDALNDFNRMSNSCFISPEEGAHARKEPGADYEDSNISTEPGNIRPDEENVLWDALGISQNKNEDAVSRCVGLSLETRPDEVTQEQLINLRRLGATKIQMGVQLLDNNVLYKNRRGHGVKEISDAFKLLRMAGFKIQIHWMPNLYGSVPDNDIKKYKTLFNSPLYRPDEIKIYPCSLIPNTELEKYYREGKWLPYSEKELINVLKSTVVNTPGYCRISRVVRDIPSDEIEAGNKKTNLRQIIENELTKEDVKINEIRFREIKDIKVEKSMFNLKIHEYKTSSGQEIFMEYTDENNRIAGFLRLSLPGLKSFIKEIKHSAMIREIHIYGVSMNIGAHGEGMAQHAGMGRQLIIKAKEIAKKHGFDQISVISSVGTREYYRKNGFYDGILYQHCELRRIS